LLIDRRAIPFTMGTGPDESVEGVERRMADDINRQRVLNFLTAFYGGDTDAALKCCADDVLLMVYLPVELFPHLGPKRGRKAIADLMAVLDARYSRRRHEVKSVVADRHRAAVIVDVTYTKRADGRVIQLPSGNFFELRRGLITDIRSFFDTIDWVSQLTGCDLVGPLLRETGSALRPPEPAPPSKPAADPDAGVTPCSL
jgi:uncharacterized protein